MAHFAFVTYEIAPFTPGGVGTYITSITQQLLKDGHRVTILIDVDEFTFSTIKNEIVNQSSLSVNLNLYHIAKLLNGEDVDRQSFPSDAHWKSYQFSIAAMKAHSNDSIDILEFVDYCGPAYYSLIQSYINPQSFPDKILIRMHNTIELIDMCALSNFNPSRVFDYYLERTSINLCNYIVSPGIRYWEDVAAELYIKPYENLYICPPVRALLPIVCDTNSGLNIVFIGRVSNIKGMDLFLRVMSLICEDKFLLNKFDKIIIIGPNESVATQDEQAILDQGKGIPKDKIVFRGKLSEAEILDEFSRAKFAIFPNKCESFCYAAHEAYLAGVPILVSSSPAYVDHFEDKINALFYDNSLSGLLSGVKELLVNSELRSKLSNSVHEFRDRYSKHGYEKIIDHSIINTVSESNISKNNDLTIIYFCYESLTDSVKNKVSDFVDALNSIKVNLLLFVRNSKDGLFRALGERWDIATLDILSSSKINIGNSVLFITDGSQVSSSFVVRSLSLIQNNEYIGAVLPVSCGEFQKNPKYGSAAVLFGSGLHTLQGLNSAMIRTAPGITIHEVFQDHTACTEISLILKLRSAGLSIVDDVIPSLISFDSYCFGLDLKNELPFFLRRNSHYFHSYELATQLSLHLQSSGLDQIVDSKGGLSPSGFVLDSLTNTQNTDQFSICVQDGIVSIFSIFCNLKNKNIDFNDMDLEGDWKIEYSNDRPRGFLTGHSGGYLNFNAPSGVVLNLSVGPSCKYLNLIHLNRAVILDISADNFSNKIIDSNFLFELSNPAKFDFPSIKLKLTSLNNSSFSIASSLIFYNQKNEQNDIIAQSLNRNFTSYFFDAENCRNDGIVDGIASTLFSADVNDGVFFGTEWLVHIVDFLYKYKNFSVELFLSPSAVWSSTEAKQLNSLKRYLILFKDRLKLNYPPSMCELFNGVNNANQFYFSTKAEDNDYIAPLLHDDFSVIIDRCPTGMDYMGHICSILKMISVSGHKISKIYLPENQNPQEVILEAFGLHFSLSYYKDVKSCIRNISGNNFLYLNPFPFGSNVGNLIESINAGGFVVLSPYEYSLLGRPVNLIGYVVDYWEDVDFVSAKINSFFNNSIKLIN